MKDSRETGKRERRREKKRKRGRFWRGEGDREPMVVDSRYQGLAMINDRVQYCFH